MNDDIHPKAELPLDFSITVKQFRSGAPWPIATLNVRSDGHVTIVSSAKVVSGVILAPMLAGTKRVCAELMRHNLREELMKAHLLRDDDADLLSEPSPALTQVTAASPDVPRDVHLQETEAASLPSQPTETQP